MIDASRSNSGTRLGSTGFVTWHAWVVHLQLPNMFRRRWFVRVRYQLPKGNLKSARLALTSYNSCFKNYPPSPRPFSASPLSNLHHLQSARLVCTGRGVLSPPAPYSRQLDKRHGLLPPTLRVYSFFFRSQCMHLLRLRQGDPLCATCAAQHWLVTLGTVLELKVLACAIICHWANGGVQHLNVGLGSTISSFSPGSTGCIEGEVSFQNHADSPHIMKLQV